MYSYEDRILAVKLYILLGKRTAATICEFGYIRWYNAERIKISLGARSPIEYQRNLGLMA